MGLSVQFESHDVSDQMTLSTDNESILKPNPGPPLSVTVLQNGEVNLMLEWTNCKNELLTCWWIPVTVAYPEPVSAEVKVSPKILAISETDPAHIAGVQHRGVVTKVNIVYSQGGTKKDYTETYCEKKFIDSITDITMIIYNTQN